jgi:hypothetical protein
VEVTFEIHPMLFLGGHIMRKTGSGFPHDVPMNAAAVIAGAAAV